MWGSHQYLAVIVGFLLLPFASASAGETHPGVKRWAVKTSAPAQTQQHTVELRDLLALLDVPGVTKNDRRYDEQRIPIFDNPLGLQEGNREPQLLRHRDGWLTWRRHCSRGRVSAACRQLLR